MPAHNAIQRITLLSFRTFGDYVLKAPFLCELFKKHPGAQVIVVTNRKGGQVYPLLDSRLKIIVVDRGDRKAQLLGKLLRVPRADRIYCLDDSRTSLLLALVLRGRRKTGWVQGVSRLYSAEGFFEWKSVSPWLSTVMKQVFHPGRIRLPETAYEGDVELELLDVHANGRPLSDYRSRFACPPAARAKQPYIYCAAEAGWVARQLTVQQWKDILEGLRSSFPQHALMVHGTALLRSLGPMERVIAYTSRSMQDLFETISAADLVIAPDSFALHLASLYDIPAIGYFGPAHPHRFRATAPGSSSLFRKPECSPCLQLRGESPCAKGLLQCLSLAQLTAADFIVAAESAIGPRAAAGETYAHRIPHA